MAENKKIWSANISRRSVLKGITYAVVATPIMVATYPAVAAKMSHASAGLPELP